MQDHPLGTKEALRGLMATKEEINLWTAKTKCLSLRSVRILLQSCLKDTTLEEAACLLKNFKPSSRSTSRLTRILAQSSKSAISTVTRN